MTIYEAGKEYYFVKLCPGLEELLAWSPVSTWYPDEIVPEPILYTLKCTGVYEGGPEDNNWDRVGFINGKGINLQVPGTYCDDLYSQPAYPRIVILDKYKSYKMNRGKRFVPTKFSAQYFGGLDAIHVLMKLVNLIDQDKSVPIGMIILRDWLINALENASGEKVVTSNHIYPTWGEFVKNSFIKQSDILIKTGE